MIPLLDCLTAVERGLSAHGQQDAVWTLRLDDLGDKLRRDGQEVDGVRLLGAHLVSLNRGDVWIHQHRFQVLLLCRTPEDEQLLMDFKQLH